MTEFAGFVAQHKPRTGNGARGPWVSDSILLEPADGAKGTWINFGFRDNAEDDFPLKQGDYVTLQAEKNQNGYLEADKKSVRKPKNPPAKPAPKQDSSRGNFKGKGGGGGFQKFDGTGIQNRTNPEDAKRMSYANARSTAVDVVRLLLEHKALPVTGAATKAGEAKRFAEITEAIDKLTVKFHNDGITLRLLDTIADTKPDTKPEGQLPPAKVGHAIDQEDSVPSEAGDTSEDDPNDGEDNDSPFG